MPTPVFGVDADGDYTIPGLPGSYSVTFVDTETGAALTRRYLLQRSTRLDETLRRRRRDVLAREADGSRGAGLDIRARRGTKNTFTGCATITPGTRCDIELPDGNEGEYVAVFGHSTPVSFGDWKAVDIDGTVTITVPSVSRRELTSSSCRTRTAT